jgi:hypothetical protein
MKGRQMRKNIGKVVTCCHLSPVHLTQNFHQDDNKTFQVHETRFNGQFKNCNNNIKTSQKQNGL